MNWLQIYTDEKKIAESIRCDAGDWIIVQDQFGLEIKCNLGRFETKQVRLDHATVYTKRRAEEISKMWGNTSCMLLEDALKSYLKLVTERLEDYCHAYSISQEDQDHPENYVDQCC